MLGGSGGTAVPLGPPSIENDVHGIKNLLLKTQISEKVLAQWSESNNIIHKCSNHYKIQQVAVKFMVTEVRLSQHTSRERYQVVLIVVFKWHYACLQCRILRFDPQFRLQVFCWNIHERRWYGPVIMVDSNMTKGCPYITDLCLVQVEHLWQGSWVHAESSVSDGTDKRSFLHRQQ